MNGRKTIIVRFMVSPWEGRRVDVGSECAKKIRQEIERLSGTKLCLYPTHYSVECGYIPGYRDTGKDLDYEVYHNGILVAILDTTCSNYTFDGSQIMPINLYKGEVIKRSKVPAFVVFSMEKEDSPLRDRCVWIRGQDIIKSPHDVEELGGKPQHNYYTEKDDWVRGLQSLVEELLKIKMTTKDLSVDNNA